MQGRHFFAAFLFLFSATALAETTPFTMMLDPFTHVPGEFNMTEEQECTVDSESATLRITTCTVPGSEVILFGAESTQVVTLDKVSHIETFLNDDVYVETYYGGQFMVAGKPLRVSIQLNSRNGVMRSGSITFQKEQVYTIVFE